MNNLILVLNCGSSSIKMSIIDPINKKEYINILAENLGIEKTRVKIKRNGEKEIKNLPDFSDHKYALIFIIKEILQKDEELFSSIIAVGHRGVHGGEKFTTSCKVSDEIIEETKKISDFAPLHNPSTIVGMELLKEILPHLAEKNVIVFDTSFHQTMEEKAYLYALPYDFYRKDKIRRYGFHGTSHYYITTQLAKYLDKDIKDLNFINCHLGNGASVCAIKNGKSVETSMGFTPLEGLVMGTRSGDIDPTIIKYLHKKYNYSIEEIDEILNKKSGLLGLTENTSDCVFAEDNYGKNEGATRAIDVFCHRLTKYIGAYMAILGVEYLDAITFTGGIGENSALIREKTINSLKLMGYSIDNEKNLENRFGNAGNINSKNTPLVMVIPTNEELIIAQETYKLIK